MKNTTRRLLPVLALAVTLTTGATAQESPTAEEVLARYVEVTGGTKAYEKFENRLTKSVIRAQGREITMTAYNAPPYQAMTITEIPGLGKSVSGVNGDVVWEESSLAGSSVKKDEERAQVLRGMAFDRLAHWQRAWTKVECAGTEKVGEEDCYVLKMIPRMFTKEEGTEADAKKKPVPDTLFFAKESGRLVHGKSVAKGPAGDMEVAIDVGDYREVDGVLFPHRLVQNIVMGAMTLEMITEVQSIAHNVEWEEDPFVLPEGIQKIVARAKK